MTSSYPGLALDMDSPAVALAREISGANDVEAVAYGTEAGHFARAGIPAVICGPGSIDQAHKPDEFVALSRTRRVRGIPAQGDRARLRVIIFPTRPTLS